MIRVTLIENEEDYSITIRNVIRKSGEDDISRSERPGKFPLLLGAYMEYSSQPSLYRAMPDDRIINHGLQANLREECYSTIDARRLKYYKYKKHEYKKDDYIHIVTDGKSYKALTDYMVKIYDLTIGNYRCEETLNILNKGLTGLSAVCVDINFPTRVDVMLIRHKCTSITQQPMSIAIPTPVVLTYPTVREYLYKRKLYKDVPNKGNKTKRVITFENYLQSMFGFKS